VIARRFARLMLAALSVACGGGTQSTSGAGTPQGTNAEAGGMTSSAALAGMAGAAPSIGGAGAGAGGRGGMSGQPGGLGGLGGLSGLGGATAGSECGGGAGAGTCSAGKAGAAGTQNPYAAPMSFADVRFGIAPAVTSGDLVRLGTMPVAVTISVGTIPADIRTRFGLTVGYVAAGVDLDAAAKKLGKDTRLALEASNPFQIFEVGGMGKQYVFGCVPSPDATDDDKSKCSEGAQHWWGGIGFAAGMAWFSGVKIRCVDGTSCGYDVNRSTEMFGRLILEASFGKRGDGGPHLSIEPTFYSSFTGPLQLLVPIGAGYEF